MLTSIRLANLFPFILLSGVLSFGLSFLIRKLATVVGLLDAPGAAPHKQHKTSTPLGGGIVIIVAIWVSALAARLPLEADILGILLGATWIFGIGLLDDAFDLDPRLKFAAQIVGAIILIDAGIQVRLFQLQSLNLAITLFWIVGMTNAFNFIDSMDGLAIGLAAIAAGFFMLVTVDSNQIDLALLSALVIGASIGIGYLNVQPAKLFLGDSGAQMLGFILASIGLLYNPIGLPQEVSWATPLMVLGVPVFDMLLVVISRIRRGVHIYHAGRDHTYHRLRMMRLDSLRAVMAMHLISGVLGLVAFIILDTTPLIANIIIGSVFLLALLLVFVFERWFSKAANGDGCAE